MDGDTEPAWVVASRLVSLTIGAVLLFLVGVIWWADTTTTGEGLIQFDYPLGLDLLNSALALGAFILAALWKPNVREWPYYASAGCALMLTVIWVTTATWPPPWWIFVPAAILAFNIAVAYLVSKRSRPPHSL